MLNALSKTIRFDNASKGFDPTEGGVSRYLLLAISEICEAQDDIRNGHSFREIWFDPMDHVGVTALISKEEKELADKQGLDTKKWKPCGFPVEIADAAIRILDIGGKFDIDFDTKEDGAHDFSYGATLDDWLLGIVEDIAMCHSYEPDSEDFKINLTRAFEAIELICKENDIPLMDIIEMKLAYNRTRPPKHGRKF